MTVLDNDLANAIQRDRRVQAIQLRLESEVRHASRQVEPWVAAGESSRRSLWMCLRLLRRPVFPRGMSTAPPPGVGSHPVFRRAES